VRPSGSLSKPGAGGYSLSQALGWGDDVYKRVQVGEPIDGRLTLNT
jgi:hypothetical protein